MKTTARSRAGIAAASSMLVLGSGLVLAPLMATASADIVVDNTPTGSYSKDEFTTSEWGQAQSWTYWCEDGEDIASTSAGQREFTTTVALDTLYIKTATTIFYWSPAPAGTYALPDDFQQSISHAILCDPTTPPPSTSTPPPSSTTAPPTTTTAPPTTTSAPPTTTSAPPTTTSAPPTTTSAPPTTSTPPVDTGTPTPSTSSPAASTTPATDPATTPASTPATTSAVSTPTETEPGLPVTGTPGNPVLLVSVGLGLVGAGAITMVASRRRGTHA